MYKITYKSGEVAYLDAYYQENGKIVGHLSLSFTREYYNYIVDLETVKKIEEV